jgi:hypothetical protein
LITLAMNSRSLSDCKMWGAPKRRNISSNW